MNTNLIAAESTSQFMGGYTPVYSPIYSNFLNRSQEYDVKAAERILRHYEAVSDIRNKRITPKDTELRQIVAMQKSKAYKSYVFMSQFKLSNFQNTEGLDDIKQQVLDEHQKAQDELFLFGEGASNGGVINNGLFYSQDSNFVENSNAGIVSSGRLRNFHTAVVTAARQTKLAGQKTIYFYGSTVLGWLDSLHESSDIPVIDNLLKVLGDEYDFARIPTDVLSGSNGLLVCSNESIKLHYNALPQVLNEGVNAESQYYWANFLQGSMMTECQAYGAIIKQPMTAEA